MKTIIKRFEECRRVIRIVTIGSSNTQRSLATGNAQNWVDWLDMGLQWWFGRSHLTINAGISGQTGQEILERFDTDVELFDPYLLFITCGGNDSNPEKHLTEKDFAESLKTMIGRARKLADCHVVLQTYYAFDDRGMQAMDRAEWAARFPGFMQVTCDIARTEGTELIDHLPRWERLKKHDYDLFLSLMHDPQHMNALGHTVFGLDILRHFRVTPLNEWEHICRKGSEVQALMDSLE